MKKRFVKQHPGDSAAFLKGKVMANSGCQLLVAKLIITQRILIVLVALFPIVAFAQTQANDSVVFGDVQVVPLPPGGGDPSTISTIKKRNKILEKWK